MTEPQIKLLSDIKFSILAIEDFTHGISSFSAYQDDLKTQSAVERQLSIIGEAVTQLLKISSLELTHAVQIKSLRNRLVHAYDNIDASIIWAILSNHLPRLKVEVDLLLNP
jgi:uncharacterized protein with HEPN domain